MIQHQLQWTTPAPLWDGYANAAPAVREGFHQPAILRFASDSFMEDFLHMLEHDPVHISSLVARPETWRGPLEEGAASSALPAPRQVSGLARRIERLRLAAERTRHNVALRAFADAPTKNRIVNEDRPATLKLYQPAHQRYYLISTCLVCGLAGLPDRTLSSARQERAYFVLRRLRPPKRDDQKIEDQKVEEQKSPDLNTWDEFAFVVTPQGSGWQPVTKTDVLPGEEQLPLFPLNYRDDDQRRRRLLAGVIPVGKRETYLGAGSYPSETTTNSTLSATSSGLDDPRIVELKKQVIEPWQQLLERAFAGARELNPATPDRAPNAAERVSQVKAIREQIQTGSWYLLLDLANYLKKHLPEVDRVLRGQPPGRPLTTAENALLSFLDTIRDNAPSSGNGLSLREALRRIPDFATGLEQAERSYVEGDPLPHMNWPTFRFTFADVERGSILSPGAGTSIFANRAVFRPALRQIVDDIETRIASLLAPPNPSALPPLPLVAQSPLNARNGWFVLRCVFERPNCGPLEPPLVSEPSVPFEMAGFFDPDAPARPIRIALPLDTTPAGLRKFDKNTAFMISDVLCGQINRVKGLTLGDLVRSVLPWPFHKDLSVPDGGPCQSADGTLNAGMMCSLSLPIITLCALLLLMIIVSLLDIIFRWIPYFILCFPLPGFKAKNN